VNAKPTVAELGIDLVAQDWQRSGDGDGALEIAFINQHLGTSTEWVLMRVADDPARRVLVYDRHEWECFLDGVKNAESPLISYSKGPKMKNGRGERI